ncbi:MAG: SpoIID/LytB domain-containing protein, partial [Candidatus Limnocylindria bacterium]
NSGSAAWTSGGDSPVNLSYHWHDEAGNTVVWDGVRTALPSDVAPGETVTADMQLVAPPSDATYRLTIDLVREGVGWFGQFGGTAPATVDVVVAPIFFAAGYASTESADAYTGEVRNLAVTVTNLGNVPWGGADVVNLAYHVLDASGEIVLWEGMRTAVGTLAVGASKQVQLTFVAPSAIGDYTLVVDAVREGVAWLGDTGSAPLRMPMKVDSGYRVGYGASTTPPLATIGARLTLRVDLHNTGPRTLAATGANAVRLSYHVHRTDGTVVTWDGLRGILPRDIGPGESATVSVDVQLPSVVGDYTVSWDLVQEGVAWLSQYGLEPKVEPISVQPGVTFFGRGFGHGLGMSQWGAQGMATGATGRQFAGEEIVAHYYPGTSLLPIAPNSDNRVIRVLLSAPSSVGRFSCGAAIFDGTLANLTSARGIRVVDEGQGNAELFIAGPNVGVQIHATEGVVRVWNQGTATPTLVYSGPGPIVTVPLDAATPTDFQEKGLYRGNFRFTNLGGTLRVLNVLGYDDYVKGVVPLEMLKDWHPEAYRAQALAARTYAYNSYRGVASDYDVLDDQSDQCYGGVRMRSGRVVETEVTNSAVETTAGMLITYQNAAIRAYFSSSSGGYTKPLGCWGFNVNIASNGSVTCNPSPPYLSGVADPADVAVSVPERNRQLDWQVTFTSDQIRDAILRYRGVDIGQLLSVDLSNRTPEGVGHVISVKVTGRFMTLDLPADRLLRDHLFLKSTLVRLSPW